ncbi:MAG: HNH endonuclease family protein, partial [Ignavibacteriae bacterium]|nr:HNH endonuclease family protein [Ignavibacteriota bacterium]
TDTLQAIYSNVELDFKEYNTAIKQAYEDSKKALKRILNDNNQTIDQFCNYLLEKVLILRVSVPKDTDLNHYFEIMNNRGEQLEKHEILKANCLEIFKNDENLSYSFNLIWEACSNIEKYVQYGFSVEQRNVIFGNNDWNTLNCKDIEDITDNLSRLKKNEKSTLDATEQTLEHLINLPQINEPKPEDEDTPDRFNTVINFSNFLLHVLRIQTKKDIPLDDKRLIELFDPYLKNSDSKKVTEFVKLFGFNLLKCKFLFDKYVIKREFLKGTDRWSLKQLRWYASKKVSYVNTFGESTENESENRSILMLLSMFHVSTPTLVYKHWLNAALKYVFETPSINSNNYKIYLENLTKAFLYDRFISNKQIDYYEIIYTNNGIQLNTDINEGLLNKGTAIENFIFNYLDYLLWKKESEYSDFEFTFRSSVEHYYPQNPIEGNEKIDNDLLDNFGNLCLISRSKNSILSNYMPQAKKEHYLNSTSIDSIKQRIMMKETNWGKDEIIKHGESMKKVLMHDRNNIE